MEFKFKRIRKSEFESVLYNIRAEINAGAGIVVQYENDNEDITAIIEDSFISKLNDEQKQRLKGVR